MVHRPNSTHLKDAIDSGRTGDKSPGFDPAAAPLGTDDEAGGASPSRFEIEQSIAAETHNPHSGKPNSVEPSITPSGGQAGGWFWIVAVVAVIVLVMLIALVVAPLSSGS